MNSCHETLMQGPAKLHQLESPQEVCGNGAENLKEVSWYNANELRIFTYMLLQGSFNSLLSSLLHSKHKNKWFFSPTKIDSVKSDKNVHHSIGSQYYQPNRYLDSPLEMLRSIVKNNIGKNFT